MYKISMTQNTLIVSNWKMNMNLSGAKKLIYKLKKIKNIEKTTKNIICPQFLLIPMVSELIKNSNIILGAQDCHHCESGSFTGDSSISLIKKYKCKFVIVGHSERRINHNEKNEIVKKKIILANKFNLSAIVCIGEPLKIYKSKKTKVFLKKQINKIFKKSNNYEEVVLAYEPLWSIGTGLTPKLSEIDDILGFLSKILENYSFKKINILYGGSVNLSNIKDILSLRNLNGVLVGSASTKSSFIKYFK